MVTESVVPTLAPCLDDEPLGSWGVTTASRCNHCIVCDHPLEAEPVVSGINDRRLGIAGIWSINRCSHCSLDQVQPRPSNAVLGELYGRYYNRVEDRLPHRLYIKIREAVMNSKLYRYWVWLDGDIGFHLRKPSRSGLRLLDIGCNQGRGMLQYQRSGFSHIEGLDINPVAVEQASKLGFPVFSGPVMQFYPKDKFDIIVLANVLEHCPIPLVTLSNVARILKSDGEVWLSMPNGESHWRKIFGRAWINWHPPFHLAHYSRQSLLKTLADVGFEVIEFKSLTPGIWLAQSLMTLRREPHKTMNLLRNPFLMMVYLLAILGLRILSLEILWGRFLKLRRRDALMVRARLARS